MISRRPDHGGSVRPLGQPGLGFPRRPTRPRSSALAHHGCRRHFGCCSTGMENGLPGSLVAVRGSYHELLTRWHHRLNLMMEDCRYPREPRHVDWGVRVCVHAHVSDQIFRFSLERLIGGAPQKDFQQILGPLVAKQILLGNCCVSTRSGGSKKLFAAQSRHDRSEHYDSPSASTFSGTTRRHVLRCMLVPQPIALGSPDGNRWPTDFIDDIELDGWTHGIAMR